MPARRRGGLLTRPVLLYDGECAFCRRWAGRLRRADRAGRIALVPAGERDRVPGLPPLTARELDRAMHLVLPDGQVLPGARALPAIFRHLPGWRGLAWVFGVPGIQRLADRLYARIAARRHRLGCGPGTC